MSETYDIPRCVWREDGCIDYAGTWNTECGQSFVLIDSTPTENNMRYCCYCGGELVQAPRIDEENEEKP